MTDDTETLRRRVELYERTAEARDRLLGELNGKLIRVREERDRLREAIRGLRAGGSHAEMRRNIFAALAALDARGQKRGEKDLVDTDGYPTDAALDRVRDWKGPPWQPLMEFVRELWWSPEWGFHGPEENFDRLDPLDRPLIRYRLSTGGWSGNESLIAAMQANYVFWTLCWWSSRRGGHYVFHMLAEQEAAQK